MAYNYTIRLSTDSDEYKIFVKALGCSSDQEILRMYLERSFLKESKIDKNVALREVLNGDAAGVIATFNCFKQNLETIVGHYDMLGVLALLRNIASKMTTRLISQLQDFIDSLPDKHQELAKHISNIVLKEVNKNVQHVLPRRYTIRIEPNIVPNDFTFNGEIEIEIDVLEDTSLIVLHAAELRIDEYATKLRYLGGPEVNVVIRPAYDPDTNFYVLLLNGCLIRGHYVLEMKYQGILRDDFRGFFRDSYVDDVGKKVWFVATHFEASDARRAFPCFDEPSFKATFKISITHSNVLKAISNMPETAMISDEKTSKTTTEFQETPKMSTYLVAFSVSDFRYYVTEQKNYRIFARLDILHLTEFAEMWGPKVLLQLESYTGIRNLQPKMDNLLLPVFNHAGMENWGLVMYRESALLYDIDWNTTETKSKIVQLLAHEYAHHWFGNLVTPSWWSSIWLSEGFATYFQYLITDQVAPSWRTMDRFVVEVLQKTAFVVDDDEKQQPMEITATLSDTHKMHKRIFNKITYIKASCVIRMFEHVLTPEKFQTGIRNYLGNKSYQAVTSDDLIRELATVGKDIKFLGKALTSWITQPGYPVVSAIRNYTNRIVILSQERFLTQSSEAPTQRWIVPINLVSAGKTENFSKTEPTYWLYNDTKTLTIPGLKSDSWIILNSQQTGYYRVNYDPRNWYMIIDCLKNSTTMKKIHPSNRAQLLDDSFHLARAQKLPDLSIFLEMTNYLQHEDDYVPWYAAIRAFKVINEALMNTDCYDLYKLYVQRLTAKIEEKLGYTEKSGEEDDVKLNRVKIMELACAMGSKKCQIAARQMMISHLLEYAKTYSPDIQTVVLCAGMRTANKEEWEMAYNYTIRLSADSDEYKIFVKALGCSSDQEILRMYLERSFLNESKIDKNVALQAVLNGDAAGVIATFNCLKQNFETIVGRYDMLGVLALLRNIASKMTIRLISQLQDFIDSLSDKHQELANHISNIVLKEVTENVQYSKKYVDTATKFLLAQHL
ncbi:aminopeptidase N-like [Venturia canescens]|uniref:aminopeptidase N-like n=1 Tax=Venturia canescens TaxID=32260 RepID=UPI001C9BC939|nr:aminopeptidase N-like [Venturia canescens]